MGRVFLFGIKPVMAVFGLGLIMLLAACEPSGATCADAGLAPVEVYFSPNGGVEDRLVQWMGQAEESLDLAIYLITSERLSGQIVAARDRGVRVRLVVDDDGCGDNNSRCTYLSGNDIDMRRLVSNGIMHHKFMVVDSHLLVTGSYNWTFSAENRNAENVIAIDDAELAALYLAEFEVLFGG